MNKFLLLLKVNISSILSPSKIAKNDYDKNNKGKFLSILLVAFIAVTMTGSITMYMFILADALYPAGLIDMVPLLGMIAATAMILFTSMYQTQSYLFSSKDMDLMLSLPVPKWTIMTSKLATLYLENLLFSAFIIIPAGAIYFYYAQCSYVFWLFYLIGWLFVPSIPLVIATFVGYLLGLVSSKFKFKNLISIISSIALVILIFVASFNMEKFFLNIATSVKSIQEMYFKLYFPAKYFYNSFVNFSIIDLIMFILLSVAPFVLFIGILSKFYIKIVSQLSASVKGVKYEHKSLKSSNALFAIYKKELGRYFSSSIYVMNTLIGMIMMIVLAVATIFIDSGSLAVLMEMPEIAAYIPRALVAMMCFMIVMTCTAASSISLEGSSLWILKSAPVKTLDIFLSKILVNLTIILPLLYISIAIFTFTVDYTLSELFVTVVITTACAIFTAVFGLALNLKFPKLDAVSDVVVVKQSICVMIMILGSMLFIGGGVGLYIALIEMISFEIYCLIISTLLIIAILGCIIFINTKGKRIFEQL